MATDAVRELAGELEGAAELTLIGKRLEILRIERGLSKQRLARHAGTSRQQLWRVMTGKSELTNSLRERLASALAVETTVITTGVAGVSQASVFSSSAGTLPAPVLPASVDVTEYLTDSRHLAATLRTLPTGHGGRRLKRALLNALEDLADESGRALPPDYPELHRRVLSGES